MNGRGRRNLFIIAAVLAVAAAVAVPRASTRAEDGGGRGLKIGYVDLSRVFKKYSLTRTLAEDLREWKIAQEAELEKKKSEVISLRDRLVTLSGDERRKAHGSMIELNRELSERGNALELEVKKRVLGNDREVYKNVCTAIDKVAERDGYDLVLQIRSTDIEAEDIEVQTLNIKSRVLLHASDELDLTDLVLETLENPGDGKEKGK